MKKNLKLILWAWLGAVLIVPLLYLSQRFLAEMAHGPALGLSIGLAVMTGVVCTFVIVSSDQSK